MTQTATANGGMAIPSLRLGHSLAMTSHRRDPDGSGQAARATPCSMAILAMIPHGQDARATSRETLGCELAAEVLRSFGRLRLRAVGASMLPAVWPGDLLSVRSDDDAEALPGDIVVFRREGRLVTHRVVERSLCQDRIQWVTRGDRVGRNDAPISSHELLGRVTAIERGSRRMNPRLTFWSRIASSILSRSEFCTGLVLRLRKTWHGTRD